MGRWGWGGGGGAMCYSRCVMMVASSAVASVRTRVECRLRPVSTSRLCEIVEVLGTAKAVESRTRDSLARSAGFSVL